MVCEQPLPAPTAACPPLTAACAAVAGLQLWAAAAGRIVPDPRRLERASGPPRSVGRATRVPVYSLWVYRVYPPGHCSGGVRGDVPADPMIDRGV